MPTQPDPLAEAIAETHREEKSNLKVDIILELWRSTGRGAEADRCLELLRADRTEWDHIRVAKIISHVGPSVSEKAVKAWRDRNS